MILLDRSEAYMTPLAVNTLVDGLTALNRPLQIVLVELITYLETYK